MTKKIGMSSLRVLPTGRKMPMWLPKMSLEEYGYHEMDQWGPEEILEHLAGTVYYLNHLKGKVERLEAMVEEFEGGRDEPVS